MEIKTKLPSFIKSIDLPVNYSGTPIGKIVQIDKEGIATIEVFPKFEKIIKDLLIENIDIKKVITYGTQQPPICPFCGIECRCNTC